MMKGITPVIAIIVLLLITVALAGATWTYLNAYWTNLVGKQIEITDGFCINSNEAVVFIRNTGTQSFVPADEISVVDIKTGNIVSVIWAHINGTVLVSGALMDAGKVARFNTSCSIGTLCSYRVVK